MTALNILFDADKIEAIKTAVGSGVATVRTAYTSLDVVEKDEAGNDVTRTLTAFERAESAYAKAATLAIAAGIPAFRPMRAVLNEDGTNAKDEDGNELFEPNNDAFGDDSIPVVAVVGRRSRKPDSQKMEFGIMAVTMFPIPSLDAYINGGDESVKWLSKITEKESAHVAFRALRNAEDAEELKAAANSMPLTVADYITKQREGGADSTELFNTLWSFVKPLLKAQQKTLHDLLPARGEIQKAIRSQSYALGDPQLEPLEKAGVFSAIGNALVQAAAVAKNEETGEPEPLDSTPIQNWLAERETFVFQTAPKDFSKLADIGGLSLTF